MVILLVLVVHVNQPIAENYYKTAEFYDNCIWFCHYEHSLWYCTPFFTNMKILMSATLSSANQEPK